MKPISSPILNLDALQLTPHIHGERYEAHIAPVASALEAKMLGARLVVLPPGKCAWPYHGHHANEEMFVILSGTGRLRYTGTDYALRTHDVVCCPAKGADSAHQIRNDGETELRYLAISTMNQPDVIDYPDSGKFVVMAGSAPGGDKASRTVDHVGRYKDAANYWEDEE